MTILQSNASSYSHGNTGFTTFGILHMQHTGFYYIIVKPTPPFGLGSVRGLFYFQFQMKSRSFKIVTPGEEQRGKKRSRDESVQPEQEDLNAFLDKNLPFVPSCDKTSLLKVISELSLGDPVVVIEWNRERLAVKQAANPQHTKLSLIQHMEQYHANNVDNSGYIFTFARTEDYGSCRANLPPWAMSIGPVTAQLTNSQPQEPVGSLYLILGTQRIVPEILKEFFFQTR
jgi:hypothetical protein